jgi:hypothetical protein
MEEPSMVCKKGAIAGAPTKPSTQNLRFKRIPRAGWRRRRQSPPTDSATQPAYVTAYRFSAARIFAR